VVFSIRCRDGKRYKILFSRTNPLQMIRLRAGVCQLDDIVYKGLASHKTMASLRLLGNEHLQPGGVYYVGDFGATASTTSSGVGFDMSNGLHGKVHQTWNLFDPVDNYASTTAEMKQRFPNFASVATEDRVPRQ